MGVAGVAAGAGVASSMMGASSARSAIKQQNQFNAQKFDLTLKHAGASLATQATAVRTRQMAERASMVEEIQSFAIEGVRRRGESSVGAAEGSVAGRTLADAQLDLARSESVTRSRANTLEEFRAAGAEQELRSLMLQAEGRAIGAIPSPVQGPSGLEVGLSAASAGFAAYSLFI